MFEFMYAILGLLLGGGAVFFYLKDRNRKDDAEYQHKVESAKNKLKELELKQRETEHKVKEVAVEAKSKAQEILDEAKKEEQQKRAQLEKQEAKLEAKENTLDEKVQSVEEQREQIKKTETALSEKQAEIEAARSEQIEQLEQISKLNKDEAKELLLKQIEIDAEAELVNKMKRVELDTKEDADKIAKNIITGAIQKYAAEVASESTATLVELPNDEMKGRVIGREGRNINAFEQATGIDVIIDDTPGSIVISGFDLVRRYIAKRALERLIEDGRIHPTRIEEVVEKSQSEVKQMMKEFGEKAVYDTGVTGLHPDLIKLLGRLRFRTSYGQNVLKHSMEVSFLASALAAEVGANEDITKKAGLLHDIGKAVDHEIEGNHSMIGRDICKKYGLSEPVIHCVEAHHEDVPFNSIEAILVQAADAISSARPGARKESLENYIKRLRELEEIANGFDGVEKTFAIQAGREVRILVDPEKISDIEMMKLAKSISQKIEKDLDYPGQIKVNMLRETRAVDFAK